MSNPKSDAFVFFGATDDLAYKKIFPALQAMVKRGHLDVPGIGVSRAGWEVEQFRARAKDSLDQQTQAYRDTVLPPAVEARLAIEQASTFGWERYVGGSGLVIGMTTVRASPPLQALH